MSTSRKRPLPLGAMVFHRHTISLQHFGVAFSRQEVYERRSTARLLSECDQGPRRAAQFILLHAL